MVFHTKGNGSGLKRSWISELDINFPSFEGSILYSVYVTFFRCIANTKWRDK